MSTLTGLSSEGSTGKRVGCLRFDVLPSSIRACWKNIRATFASNVSGWAKRCQPRERVLTGTKTTSSPPRTYRRTAERCELRQAVHAAKRLRAKLEGDEEQGEHQEGTQLHCLVLHENNRIQWLIKGKDTC